MILRPATPSDAPAIATLIASFQPLLTNDPSGAGAEHFLASVSEDAERQYLESDRYRFIVAEAGAVLAGVVALRDSRHLFHLFVDARFQRQGLADRLWRTVRDEALCPGHPGEFTVNASLNAVPAYGRLGFVATGDVQSVHGISFRPMRWCAAA